MPWLTKSGLPPLVSRTLLLIAFAGKLAARDFCKVTHYASRSQRLKTSQPTSKCPSPKERVRALNDTLSQSLAFEGPSRTYPILTSPEYLADLHIRLSRRRPLSRRQHLTVASFPQRKEKRSGSSLYFDIFVPDFVNHLGLSGKGTTSRKGDDNGHLSSALTSQPCANAPPQDKKCSTSGIAPGSTTALALSWKSSFQASTVVTR